MRRRMLSQGRLWSLFLMAALPTHIWTIVLVLQDVSWISERTNTWDAVGVGAYGLLLALVESTAVFVVALLLNLLLPRRWEEDQRLTALTGLIFALAAASMLNQGYFLGGARLPGALFALLLHSGHPLRILYGAAMLINLTLIGALLYLTDRKPGFVSGFLDLIERLSVLMTLYLALDVAALIVVILRNV